MRIGAGRNDRPRAATHEDARDRSRRARLTNQLAEPLLEWSRVDVHLHDDVS